MLLQKEPGRIYASGPDGRLLAEITFPQRAPGIFEIDHTFVDASLRGQGAADQLVRAALEEIRAQDGRIRPTCTYAAAWFRRHGEYAPFLAD